MTRQQVENLRDEMIVHLHDCWKEQTADNAKPTHWVEAWEVTERLHAALCLQLQTMPAANRPFAPVDPVGLAVKCLENAAARDKRYHMELMHLAQSAQRFARQEGGAS